MNEKLFNDMKKYLFDDQLTATEKIIMQYLSTINNEHGALMDTTISCGDIGMSRNTAYATIKRLVEKGYLHKLSSARKIHVKILK